MCVRNKVMKNIKSLVAKFSILIIIISLFVSSLVLGLGSNTAFAASNVTCSSATISGRVITNGTPTYAWFEWGPNGSLNNSTPRQLYQVDQDFSANLTGLQQNTTYSYRAMAQNQYGNATGQTFTFTTLNCTQTTPSVNLTANPSTIQRGQSSTLSWTSQNATSCSASWTGSNATSGSQTVSPQNTTTYSITCYNSQGQSATDTATVTVNQIAQFCQDPNAINYGGPLPCRYDNGVRPTVDITADDTRIDEGDSTIVRWTSHNADRCTASGGRNGWSGTRGTSGSFHTGDLNNDTTYTITCSNNFGSASDSVTVRVDDDNDGDRPTVTISANPSSVPFNGSSTVTWSSRNADSCTAYGGTNGWSGSRSRSGSFFTGSLSFTTTFSITCRNENGSDSDSTTVVVSGQPQNNQPSVFLSADSNSVAFGGSTTIRWTSVNATTCFASGGSNGWAGTRSTSGSFFTGSLTSSRTYSITCSNSSGSASDSTTVTVRGQVLGTSTATGLLVLSSNVNHNAPIVPILDNSNPCPGDEINYTLNYQNVGTGTVSNLILRVDLPNEVDYINSTPANPSRQGNTLVFSLGSLRANGQGSVMIKTRLREGVPAGTNLNFGATMTYVDPTGAMQSVSANVSANVCGTAPALTNDDVSLSSNVWFSGFLPNNLFGWLLLIILILILIALLRYLFGTPRRQMITTYEDPGLGKKTTTVTH